MGLWERLAREERGQAMTEYAFILGLVAAVVAVTLGLLGPAIAAAIGRVTAAF